MPDPTVTVREEPVVLPTYEPLAPDRNPMFLETRVYQGSSGRVYPLPFCDRIAEQPRPHAWAGIWLENEFLRVLILPEIGGRIHRLVDKTTGADVIYHQPVIKPALVGLAGPWISGGIEVNWPQHHRPSTFLPADHAIERHADGGITVWLGEHDPMTRMKGMHGICLHPGRSYLELKGRVYNRTGQVQTFLWWANAAVEVHEHYQSFFPPDTTHVADHAKRATSTFPLCTGRYYGVDYAARARHGVPAAERPAKFQPPGTYPANDLSWYANIPVPTSYMGMGSREDFFGGYDHRARTGLVHVADHHIAPGKKQWTWGNHEFGYAWDRNLDERARPYIELMAGVYTDNQPDFSFLQPGETKAWSQYWYPIREIGPAQHANLHAAVSLRVTGRSVRIGASVTAVHPAARLTLGTRRRKFAGFTVRLAPDAPFVTSVALPRSVNPTDLVLRVADSAGAELIVCTVGKTRPALSKKELAHAVATEPPPPAEVKGADELYLTGLHLEQYRHATRAPELYWREALRRDPGDSRCHTALGRWHLRRGEWLEAEKHLRAAIARLTRRNPNPADGEAYYQLGLCLRHTGRETEAYDAFYKATWNQAWQPAGFHALAELDCRRHDWPAALAHLDQALLVNPVDLRARNLRTLVLTQLGRKAEAAAYLTVSLVLDPLDWWARELHGEALRCDIQTRLDLALDCARAGFHAEALAVLADARPEPPSGAAPLVSYYRAWLCDQTGDAIQARRHLAEAAKAPPDYCFPARLEELAILCFAQTANPRDALAPYLLGNWLYDRRRHDEAIRHWEISVRLRADNSVAWRNLGLGYYNIRHQPAKARAAYRRAREIAPTDARLLYESDQLDQRAGVASARRLAGLERQRALVDRRDDLTVEFCALLNDAGRHDEAADILGRRRFQPWEGGEGLVLGQYVRTQIALGRRALSANKPDEARRRFATALHPPPNLGEAPHLLLNQSEIHYWLGRAGAAAGDAVAARAAWSRAARATGDFQGMRIRDYSAMTYYSALACRALGRRRQALTLLNGLLAHGRRLRRQPAKIDYFATSLPTMLLFADDPRQRQNSESHLLAGLALLGIGRIPAARREFRAAGQPKYTIS